MNEKKKKKATYLNSPQLYSCPKESYIPSTTTDFNLFAKQDLRNSPNNSATAYDVLIVYVQYCLQNVQIYLNKVKFKMQSFVGIREKKE